MSKTYGYVRVSARDQNEARQLIAMERAHVPRKHIIVEKQTGKDFERGRYRKLLKKLKPGDLLIVESIDRLGRNYAEILEQWRIITKERRADIRILDMPLLDTTMSKDLLGTFIADLVLQILSFVAENERANIRTRQREGIDAARAKGVRFGRPRNMNAEIQEAIRLYQENKIPLSQAVELSGVSRSTFFNRMKA